MIRKTPLAGSKLLLASIVAGSMAAPLALTQTAVSQNFQEPDIGESTGGEGAADERVQGSPNAFEEEGMEAMDEDMGTSTASVGEIDENVYEILGTTREEAESADTQTSATAQYGPLEAYQTEIERGNLDAAAENLAAIAEDPITQKMVTDVNTELGVETDLTAKQVADVAAEKQNSTEEESTY